MESISHYDIRGFQTGYIGQARTALDAIKRAENLCKSGALNYDSYIWVRDNYTQNVIWNSRTDFCN